MTRVFLLKNADNISDIASILVKNDFSVSTIDTNQNPEDIFSQINNESPDVILVDDDFENAQYLVYQIKSDSKNNSQ